MPTIKEKLEEILYNHFRGSYPEQFQETADDILKYIHSSLIAEIKKYPYEANGLIVKKDLIDYLNTKSKGI